MLSRKSTPSSNGKTLPPSSQTDSQVQEQTPPPDNFSSMKPCSHIKSVLESKAKENVFITYRQAVYISQSISKDNIYTQKKDGAVVSNNKLVELKSKSLRCTECSLNNFHHNFICLQCPHVGCCSHHNHAHVHYKMNQHLFAIDSHNGLLYCFLCGDYINDPELEKIRIGMLTGSSSTLLDEENIDDNYNDPTGKAVSGLKGFINLGSTCFMSCILQTLIHNPIIKYQFFNNDLHYFNCEHNYDYSTNGVITEQNACITCSIDNIFKNFFTSDDTEGFGMTNLLMTSWFKKKSLAGSQEQDAHEFWQFLLNEFHQDYLRVSNKKFDHDHCKCITHTTFSGQLESSIICAECNSTTRTTDPMIDLSLEIDHMKRSDHFLNLYDCLDLFTKEEKLDVMYKCQHCDNRSRAKKSLRIKKIPPVLSIQLKRFKHNLHNDTFSKIEIPIDIPLFLNITKYTSASMSPELDGDKIFELFALVCHIGSVNTGHYIVIIKNGNGQWLKFDDSVISLISQEEVVKANAYLLFYITHKI